MAKILVVGCGKIGDQVARKLTALNHQVHGLRRSLQEAPYHTVTADVCQIDSLGKLDQDFDLVIIALSPDERNQDSYERIFQTGIANLVKQLGNAPQMIFVSSTSVYNQNLGEWVNETSRTHPSQYQGQTLLAAEALVLASQSHNSVVRFAGIYGPGRERLIKLAQSGQTIQKSLPYFTNRIHEQDCVGFLVHLTQMKLNGETTEAIYCAADDTPAPLWDVVRWISFQMDIPEPPSNRVNQPDQNKRVANARMKATGYELLYPSYRDGYGEMIQPVVKVVSAV